jgi:hypothetical protein
MSVTTDYYAALGVRRDANADGESDCADGDARSAADVAFWPAPRAGLAPCDLLLRRQTRTTPGNAHRRPVRH